jgi:hypothetical protein
MSRKRGKLPNRRKLEWLVNRANSLLSGKVEGFVGCSIMTDNPPVVAFDFSGPNDAHKFMLSRQVKGADFHIDDSKPSRVLQRVHPGKVTI